MRASCLRALALAVLAAAGPAVPAAAQSLDATVEEQVEDQVDADVTETVEDDVQEQVESDVTDAVEDQVESDVAETVEDQVESDVTQTVESQVQSQVESDVAGTVEDQVESDVAGTVESQVQDQVESDLVQTVEEQVASGVAGTVQEQVESGVVETVREQVESGVAETLDGDVTGSVEQTVEQQLERLLGEERGEERRDLVNQIADLVEELGIEDVGEAIERAVERSRPIGADEEGEGDDDGDSGEADEAERYVAGVDALGRAAENGVWVILVPAQYAARIQDWGFTIREQRDLGGLDRVLLRVDAPGGRDIAQAALELAIDAPGTHVDFNHVYRATDEQTAGALETTGRIERDGAPARGRPGLEVGIVDSAIAADHESLAAADIAQQDFVPFTGARPTGHGTAVASILVGHSSAVRGVLTGARLHAASVFFQDEAGEEIATTDGLVSALEWLVARGVGVVNMSLAGPPNRVLETAIEAATERDAVIVAAVGNNGPAGEPLYPAAYERVVGVTAVDEAHRVYHYANRGRQVMFSAPGVEVRVARSAGGYARRSGTSMAAPHAAAIITKSLAARAAPADGVLASLKAAALDLGDKDFDEIYGYGLIGAAD